MKLIKYFLPVVIAIVLISCSNNDDDIVTVNEIEDLLKVQEISNENHTIEVFTKSGSLVQGFNNITIRIKDIQTLEFVENASITWKPMMHMMAMMHTCPKSALVKVAGKETVYNGFIIFQMPENETEGWDLTFNYTINGVDYEVVDNISVPQAPKRTVTTFTGTDDVKYILALIDPQSPEVKINDMVVGLYKMENMMSFPAVENYKISLDPRMPSMGNHSSPNNENLVYNAISKLYAGKLSLTMTGYWKLNLMLMNQNDEILKGEAVTEENEASSLFLELEF
ncbi:MAG: hypothetical protein GQ540_12395 [Lutibacter sp.]|uniref:hypothetical protein n=1 Tax=Lutibacter sp. TaxID=1925666 RepID=UPI001A0E5758|nr:hypothetical protein [Lutibacter sp.]NOR29317.1 hypothetical protein [Lutibacter sp.]